MRFLKSVLLAGVASAMFLGACPRANAGSILVLKDSGTGTLTLTGTTPGLDVTFGSDTAVTSVNGHSGPPLSPGLPLLVDMPTFHFVGSPSLMAATGTKIIYDGTDTVTMSLTLHAMVFDFFGSDFLVISGTVTNVMESNPGGGTYDWYPIDHTAFLAGNPMAAGGILPLVNGSGTVTDIPGTFSQGGVIPEPSSVVLMGLGVVALAGVARFRRRNRPC